MSPITFFRGALLVPLIVPALFLFFGVDALVAVFMLSMAFGGIAYCLFAVVAAYVVGRLRSADSIRSFTLVAPLLYLPFVVFGLFVQNRFAGTLEPLWGVLLPATAYSLALGYVYVILVNIVYEVFVRLGVANEGREAL